MTDFAEQINKHISGKMNPEEILEFESNLAKNEDLKEQYLILLSAREYIKAKLVLEEIESDPDLPIIMDQVIDHYEGNEAYKLDAINLPRTLYILIPAILLGILLLFQISIHLR